MMTYMYVKSNASKEILSNLVNSIAHWMWKSLDLVCNSQQYDSHWEKVPRKRGWIDRYFQRTSPRQILKKLRHFTHIHKHCFTHLNNIEFKSVIDKQTVKRVNQYCKCSISNHSNRKKYCQQVSVCDINQEFLDK